MNNGHTQEAVSPFSVEKATPAGFASAWGYIRRGLLAVKKNTPAANWVPEQVRRQVEQGFSQHTGCEFFFCLEARTIVGFYITLPQVDPWLQCNLIWLVWIVYSSGRGLIDRIEPIVEQQARERGYVGVDFVSASPRLAKHMERHGWKPLQTITRKTLEY